MRTGTLVLMLLAVASAASAQSAAPVQIRSAVAPLPEEFRDGATVLGYETGKNGLVQLKEGAGPFICLADDPSDDRFHVACYHRALEPFMARGRELRAHKVTNVDSVRYAEIEAKTLDMPLTPSALYSLTGKAENVAADGTVSGARPLYVIYIPFATTSSTGLPAKPEPNMPWLMFPGSPKAHIMFVPRMQ